MTVTGMSYQQPEWILAFTRVSSMDLITCKDNVSQYTVGLARRRLAGGKGNDLCPNRVWLLNRRTRKGVLVQMKTTRNRSKTILI